MSKERFRLIKIDDYVFQIHDTDNDLYLVAEQICKLLNELNDENQELKQQLLYDGGGVCDICKHEYLTPSGDYFIGKCEKGHEECSKGYMKYCEDFKLKESLNE